MWDGKQKAVTYSYDDGVCQDRRLVDMFNYYHVKATFNINSGMQTYASHYDFGNVRVHHMNAEGLKELYKGHEIAVHTLTHQDLTKLDKDTVYNEVFLDKQNLERMFGCQITGMAYPYGTYNDEVVQILKKCKIQYARSVVSSGAFKLQKNLLIFKPTCHHADENIWELLEKFLKEKSEEKQLFYIWGHSYEFDVNNNWKRMEEILDRLIGHNNIFYGTNREVLLPC